MPPSGIGIILALFINFFLRSSAFDFIISIIGVIIFTGLTAYDTQKIARLASDPRIEGEGSHLARNVSSDRHECTGRTGCNQRPSDSIFLPSPRIRRHCTGTSSPRCFA